jgi:multimeric flavodoxin WrbA
MKILGIAGSPRRDGNTFLLLQKTLEGTIEGKAETEFIFIPDLKISPCRECGGCDKTGKCVVDDDMQIMYPKLQDADRIIIASPIFFGGVTANLKIMIDRCQCLWVKKYILKQPMSDKTDRKGAFISACGGKRTKFFPGASLTIRTLFKTLDISYVAELFFSQIDNKGAVINHPTALKEAFSFGVKLLKL